MVLLFLVAMGTAALSGTFGMAGGLVLMGVFAAILPVPEAMVLHGLTQLGANGGRAWLLRAHVARTSLRALAAGALGAGVVGGLSAVEPPRAWVYLGLGALPWAARALPRGAWVERGLDAGRPGAAALCGALVVGAQTVAGAAGPLLDLFFLGGRMDRRQVVATKAAAQAIAHALKVGVFLGMVDAAGRLVAPALVCLAGAAVGTRIGTLLLSRLSEEAFRRWSGRLVLGVGAAYVLRGLHLQWVSGHAT
jgi:uncharacterized protein